MTFSDPRGRTFSLEYEPKEGSPRTILARILRLRESAEGELVAGVYDETDSRPRTLRLMSILSAADTGTGEVVEDAMEAWAAYAEPLPAPPPIDTTPYEPALVVLRYLTCGVDVPPLWAGDCYKRFVLALQADKATREALCGWAFTHPVWSIDELEAATARLKEDGHSQWAHFAFRAQRQPVRPEVAERWRRVQAMLR